MQLNNEDVPEGFLDLFMTVLAALHDLMNDHPTNSNSRCNSVYIVKPKLHGPAEVQFTVELFDKVEGIFSLPPKTLKVGIMDEERRTSANLGECIKVPASERAVRTPPNISRCV